MLLSSRKYRTYKYFPSFHLFFLQLHDSRKFKIFSNYLKKKKKHFLLIHRVQTIEENLLVTRKYTEPFHNDESVNIVREGPVRVANRWPMNPGLVSVTIAEEEVAFLSTLRHRPRREKENSCIVNSGWDLLVYAIRPLRAAGVWELLL